MMRSLAGMPLEVLLVSMLRHEYVVFDACVLRHIALAGVYFGQLLGMADHLSFTLGRAGYRIHKIVPYGPVHETLQYLIRCPLRPIAILHLLPPACLPCQNILRKHHAHDLLGVIHHMDGAMSILQANRMVS